jgi:hypothetical protein
MAGLIGNGAGVSNSLREAPVFYGFCAVGGMALSLASVNPIKLLVLVAVINGVTAGPFLISVMRVSPDRAIMGESINGALAGWLDWHRRRRGFLRDRRPLGMKCARVGERDGSTRSARRSG